MNPYYGSNLGRFLTPDPYGGSAKPATPQSWNRHAYVTNDPISQNDPSGLDPIPTFGVTYNRPNIGPYWAWEQDDWFWGVWGNWPFRPTEPERPEGGGPPTIPELDLANSGARQLFDK